MTTEYKLTVENDIIIKLKNERYFYLHKGSTILDLIIINSSNNILNIILNYTERLQ